MGAGHLCSMGSVIADETLHLPAHVSLFGAKQCSATLPSTIILLVVGYSIGTAIGHG